MSSNSVRHNDDLNPFIRSYDVKSLQSVLYSVVEGKTEEAYVIVRNSRNYPMHISFINACLVLLLVPCSKLVRSEINQNINK